MSTLPDHITPSGAEAYRTLVEAPGSPIWTHPREDRLTPAMRREVQAFAALVRTHPPAWHPGRQPAWLDPWLERIWGHVPALARRGPRPPNLGDITPTSRSDLAADPAAHVPDDIALDELLAYSTSGTASAPMTVPSHPVTTASYYPLLRHAASWIVDVDLRPDHLDWVTVISQEVGGYVIPSWSSTTGTLTAQISLHADRWRTPADIGTFLADHDPRVITGDPVAFDVLLELDPSIHPQLLVSTASALSAGLRERLETRFGAPVLDVLSLTETGPVAVSTTAGGPHRLVQPRLFVETLRPDGSPTAEGEQGEIVLTGGMNRALPLVRYRTGDRATLRWTPDATAPVLDDVEGRPVVVFRTLDGGRVNSHSVTVALRPLALPRLTLHQDGDGGLILGLDDPDGPDATRALTLLGELFPGSPIAVVAVPTDRAKVVPYSTD
ncbi:AMP-binding protein [Euzebya rosea]|uniref:AMP-binding protein n=1 Tax=Euzebya rosea TaxID=2052804 RepID=UPI000D3E64D2|nr:AMP-binding protein [Euzebya rosea]